MKRDLLFIVLFLISCLLSACGVSAGPASSSSWTAYHAATKTVVNPQFPAYAFEYPTSWKMEEGVNHISFASEASLLNDPPERLQPGQIMAGLSINVGMPPKDMVESYITNLGSTIHFEELVSVQLNGHQAAYQQGVDSETGEGRFVLAVDMGGDTRALLTARIAQGEFETWQETLFKMAESLQVEQ